MPTLSESQQPRPANYSPVTAPSIPPVFSRSLEPVFNPVLRCPLPPINAGPDNLRQYYRGGDVPQSRIMPPGILSGTGNTAGGAATSSSASTSTSTTTTTTVTLVSANASVTTPSLDAGVSFLGTIQVARTFALIAVTANAACRVQLYATQSYQIQDQARPDTQALNAGTTQGTLEDVSLDTAPFSWYYNTLPVVANADSPRTPSAYITITNIAQSSNPITVTLLYLPLES